MEFIVSSKDLLSRLNLIKGVVGSKNVLPILDNFLFTMTDNHVSVTASNLEISLVADMDVLGVKGEYKVAIPIKILTDSLKGLSDQPITFDFNTEKNILKIKYSNGEFIIQCFSGDEFPIVGVTADEKVIEYSASMLLEGISRTLFAVSEDELRPVLSGILFEVADSGYSFTATDSHKLVSYTRMSDVEKPNASFVLPKKACLLLKNLLATESYPVTVSLSPKNAVVKLFEYTVISRLIEGNYPAYRSVIPKDNKNIITVNRQNFTNALKRVSVFSNPASNLVKLDVKGSKVKLSAQDLDYSVSAFETVDCEYEGSVLEIGFKSAFLQEMLASIITENVVFTLSDGSKAGLIKPSSLASDESIVMLLMPMLVN